MTERELYDKLVYISGVADFQLELVPIHSKCYWGRYYPNRKLIRLYEFDVNGQPYDAEVLIREGLHELSHHIQYYHLPFWERKKGVMHDEEFWKLYRGMYYEYFGVEVAV